MGYVGITLYANQLFLLTFFFVYIPDCLNYREKNLC